MPVVRCSEAASGTFTLAEVPLNESALPNFPAVDRVAAAIVPVLLLPDASRVETPEASLNEYAATRPVGDGWVFDTSTITAVAWVELLAASRATADIACRPFGTVALFH